MIGLEGGQAIWRDESAVHAPHAPNVCLHVKKPIPTFLLLLLLLSAARARVPGRVLRVGGQLRGLGPEGLRLPIPPESLAGDQGPLFWHSGQEGWAEWKRGGGVAGREGSVLGLSIVTLVVTKKASVVYECDT